MTLIAIVMGTLAAGIGSVWLAALLSFGVLARYTQHMLSLAAGALLATAFMHLLPEAFESQAGADDLFMTLLIGLVFFFLLDKAELWHHGHEHHHDSAHRAEMDCHALLAVLAHEVPHHMGDLMVLRSGSSNKQMALVKVSLAGAVTALGGLAGFWLVEQLQDYLPYFLVVASSSFVYVALADLIPQLQKRLTARETATQVAWLFAGFALVTVVSGLAHSR